MFETQPTVEKINLTLAVLADRKVDCGHCVRFESKYYNPIDSDSNPTYFRKGTSALVIKAFDGEYYVSIENKIYGLEVIPDHKATSKNFDFPKDNPVKCKSYVPPMSHPWKHASFQAYLDKQTHRSVKTG